MNHFAGVGNMVRGGCESKNDILLINCVSNIILLKLLQNGNEVNMGIQACVQYNVSKSYGNIRNIEINDEEAYFYEK